MKEEINNYIINILLPWLNKKNIYPHLIYYSGSFLNQTFDEQSDIDIDIITDDCQNFHFIKEFSGRNCSIFIMSIDEILYTAKKKIINSFEKCLISEEFIIYNDGKYNKILEQDIDILSDIIQNYYQNCSIINNFLDNNIFNKKLYHFVLAYEILTKEKIDRQILIDIKRGKNNALCREYLLKLKDILQLEE